MLWNLLQPPEGAQVLDKSGRVLPPSSSVFKDLSEKMKNKYPTMTPKNIYTIILNRRYNIYDRLLTAFGIVDPNTSQSDRLDSSNDSMANVITFNLNITDIWQKFQPELVNYKFRDGRTRDLLCMKRNSWTSFLYERIWSETKIPCSISFRSAKCSDSGIFLKISGKCLECKCEFTGCLANKPQSNVPILMDCKIEGFDHSVKHSKKRQLRGEMRTTIANKLINSNEFPCQWRREEANKLMVSLGEKEPPHLYSGDVLCKAKQEAQDKFLDIQSTKVFDNLQQMMYATKYDGAIRRIGLDPVYVMYWTKEQEAIYDHYHHTVYIDGTGSLVHKLKLPNGDLCSHIYLYQMVTQVDNKTAPVLQMLSSVQTTDDIYMWLRVFLRNIHLNRTVARIPKECVTDFDKALLGAVVQAFAQVTNLKSYIELCFDLLSSNSNSKKLPPCLIRLDVCHFSNMLAKWKCFRDKHPQVRKFYLHAVAIMRTQETLKSFTEIATAIIMLALNPYEHSNGLTECARNFLAAKIRGSSFDDVDDDTNVKEKMNETSGFEICESDMATSTIQQWVQTLYDDVLKRIEAESCTVALNGYYCPSFAKKLKALLPYFPLFSEVMRVVFRYGSINATSTAVESEFNDLKNRTFKNSLPLRLDKFVARHILSFSGKLKLAMDETKFDSPRESNNNLQNCDLSLISSSYSPNRFLENATCVAENENPIIIEKSVPIQKKRSCNFVKHCKKEIPSPNETVKTDIIDFEEIKAEHNWRNKNSSKKRFKYADPCP